MASNVEIKARVADLAALRERALALGAAPAGHLQQRDTFFRVARGRLKLRELGPGDGELIFYERPDAPGPKRSDYAIHPTGDPATLRELLGRALGVRGVVEKRRELLMLGRTRIHLDQVRGLGDFLELEVVLDADELPANGEKVAHEILGGLGVPATALVSGAYIDLLESGAAWRS